MPFMMESRAASVYHASATMPLWVSLRNSPFSALEISCWKLMWPAGEEDPERIIAMRRAPIPAYTQ